MIQYTSAQTDGFLLKETISCNIYDTDSFDFVECNSYILAGTYNVLPVGFLCQYLNNAPNLSYKITTPYIAIKPASSIIVNLGDIFKGTCAYSVSSDSYQNTYTNLLGQYMDRFIYFGFDSSLSIVDVGDVAKVTLFYMILKK